jgi:hypothetical protein
MSLTDYATAAVIASAAFGGCLRAIVCQSSGADAAPISSPSGYMPL